jgi:hypothetical protein
VGPDGVVYKVPLFSEFQVLDELVFFRFISEQGFSWAPDFWYYREHKIVAMPLYERYPYPRRLEDSDLISVIKRYTRDCGHSNMGLKGDGSLVLIDGGYAYPGGRRG